jgi:hypothetical protein
MTESISSGNLIALCEGGGAQHGLGEQVSLELHSGPGNGIFGLGWGTSVPSVTRKTAKGTPHSRDYDRNLQQRGAIILSEAEDLVPVSDSSLDLSKAATRYRPRTEGLFARSINHRDELAVVNSWEECSRDGLICYYGTNPADKPPYLPTFRRQITPATIGGPKRLATDPDRKFGWKLLFTQDWFADQGAEARKLPPVEFGYADFRPQDRKQGDFYPRSRPPSHLIGQSIRRVAGSFWDWAGCSGGERVHFGTRSFETTADELGSIKPQSFNSQCLVPERKA